ncbi:hypothetical protein AA103587_2647 [Gluconobacter kanchanaburiensis NBRC 103587]|nr:hypothetical protein AA103587_2647 [Gluconobacter kanchanaburiensis NBRC 103587]
MSPGKALGGDMLDGSEHNLAIGIFHPVIIREKALRKIVLEAVLAVVIVVAHGRKPDVSVYPLRDATDRGQWQAVFIANGREEAFYIYGE